VGALAVGTLLDGRYALEDLLGRGGMAAVYRARDRRLDRPVAVKVLDRPGPHTDAAAWREDRITAALHHPNIVTVYDSGTMPDGKPYLVLELIEGEPVARLAPLPPGRALALAEQVAGALAYAHARGVVHCDLTPHNVLVDAFGQAKLTDFGVAGDEAEPVGETVYGSAPYLAPERLRGAPTSPAVDLYALGATLYHLLTGRPPYAARDPSELLARVDAGLPPPVSAAASGVPPAVDELVARALAPDPADRYPSAEAFRAAIAAARRAAEGRTGEVVAPRRDRAATAVLPAPRHQAGGPPAATAAPPAPAAGAIGRRPRWLVPLLALLVVALLLAGLGRAAAGLRQGTAGAGGNAAGATIEVPNLSGQSLGQAYHQLVAAGLTPGRADIAPGQGQPTNAVVFQDPPAGTRVRPGTPVNFVVRTAP
jgi:hypothetical protein